MCHTEIFLTVLVFLTEFNPTLLILFSVLVLFLLICLTTFFLAAFGVGGIIYSLAWLYGVFSQEGVTLLSKIIVFIYVISMLSKEPHYYFSLTYIFLFYLLSSYKKNEQLFNLHNPKSSLNNTGGGK